MSNENPLLKELKKVINEIVELEEENNNKEKNSSNELYFPKNFSFSDSIQKQTLYERCLTRLCYMIEKILEYGLNDVSLFGTGTYPWNYIENLDKCLPGSDVKEILRKVKDVSKTNIGRGRVFIRLTLNESSISDYLSALIWNIDLTKHYYRKTSILNNEEYASQLISSLENLKKFPFDFIVNDKNLDSPDYWIYLTRKSGSVVNNDNNSIPLPAFAHPNLTSFTKLTKLPNLETINSIIQQAENAERELIETRKKILELKIQLEREKIEKNKILNENNQLKKKYEFMNTQLKDLEIELSVYKTSTSTINVQTLENFDEEQNIIKDQILKEINKNQQENQKINNIENNNNNNNIENNNNNNIENNNNNEQENNFLQESELLIIQKFQQAQNFIKEIKNYDEVLKEKLKKNYSF